MRMDPDRISQVLVNLISNAIRYCGKGWIEVTTQHADDTIAAAESAKIAIAARDMEAIFEAGDALYQPCEACHIDFNPGVASD